METTETNKVLTPKEERIAKLMADSKAKLEKDIADIEKEEAVKEARVKLDNDIKSLTETFETTYGVKYKSDETQTESEPPKKLSIEEKCKMVVKEMANGKPKFTLSEDGKGILGANGEKITSVIKFDDENKKKQTLGVTNYFKYLNPNVTKEELNKLFPLKIK